MKYLLALLSTAFLLISCSKAETPINLGEPTAETAAETAEAEGAESDADAADPEADDSKADGEKSEDEDDKGEGDKGDKEKSDLEGVDQKNVKLEVANQKTAGQIIIKKIATSRDGWVSIHKSREDGSIVVPESIGEARVDSGDSEEIIVDLWESPDVGDKLWALLHIDAGERGTYEFPDKDVPVRKNGETMARSFTIQGEKKKDEEKDDAE